MFLLTGRIRLRDWKRNAIGSYRSVIVGWDRVPVRSRTNGASRIPVLGGRSRQISRTYLPTSFMHRASLASGHHGDA